MLCQKSKVNDVRLSPGFGSKSEHSASLAWGGRCEGLWNDSVLLPGGSEWNSVRDLRCGGERQPAAECFSTDCGIKGGRRVSQKWGSLLFPLLCLPGPLPLVTFPSGFLNGTKQRNLWGQKPGSLYVGQHAPATVSGLATCLWPLAVSALRKEPWMEEAGTWGMSPLLLWLGLLLCVSGKEKQVRRPEDRVPARGTELEEGRQLLKEVCFCFSRWPGRRWGMC